MSSCEKQNNDTQPYFSVLGHWMQPNLLEDSIFSLGDTNNLTNQKLESGDTSVGRNTGRNA